MNENKAIHDILNGLLLLFRRGNESRGLAVFTRINDLRYDSDEFWQEITSLDIWGGSGSLLDQAFIEGRNAELMRAELDALLFQLSEYLIQSGHTTRFVISANLVLRKLV